MGRVVWLSRVAAIEAQVTPEVRDAMREAGFRGRIFDDGGTYWEKALEDGGCLMVMSAASGMDGDPDEPVWTAFRIDADSNGYSSVRGGMPLFPTLEAAGVLPDPVAEDGSPIEIDFASAADAETWIQVSSAFRLP